jgi:SAM-dependent methyltransferase
MNNLIDLPFDQYQRYRIIAEIAACLRPGLGLARWRVLDVGGYSRFYGQERLVLPQFLPQDDVLVLDLPPCALPGYLQGNGQTLPFTDGSFDVVVSCDALEHVAADQRQALLSELTRVAKSYVLLIAPFDSQETRLAEEIFFQFHVKKLGGVQTALLEHLANGLPRQEEVEEFLAKRGLAYRVFPSGYLYRWLLMMVLKHYVLSLPDALALHARVDRLYNMHFFPDDQRAPSYRYVYVISKQGETTALAQIAALWAAWNPEPGEGSETFARVSQIATLQLLTSLLVLEGQPGSAERLDVAREVGQGIVGEIVPPRVIGQSFLCRQPNLCRLDVLVSTYGRARQGELVCRLWEGEVAAGPAVATVAVPIATLQSERWCTFRFRPIAASAGRCFHFTLEAPASHLGDAVTVYCDQVGSYADGVRFEDGQQLPGSLVFRSYGLPPDSGEAERRRLQELEAAWQAQWLQLQAREGELADLKQQLAAAQAEMENLRRRLDGFENSWYGRLLQALGQYQPRLLSD